MTLAGKIGLAMSATLGLLMLIISLLPGWTDYDLVVSEQANLPPAIFNNFKLAGELAGLSVDSPYASRICLLGTDELGRDYLSGLMRASLVSLGFSLGIAVLSILIAFSLASLAAWYGGWVDGLVMRLVDILYAVPSLASIILVLAIFGAGQAMVFVCLLGLGWYSEIKVLGIQIKIEISLPYCEALRGMGAGLFRTMVKHVLPNLGSVVWTLVAMRLLVLVLQEAFLSFIGFGPSPPWLSWGILLRDGILSLDHAGHRLFSTFAVMAWFLTGISLFLDGLAKQAVVKR